MKFLPLIWSNLKRKKLRTLLTMLSIAVAFILYGFLCAIERAMNAGIDVAKADRLIVRHRVSIVQMLPLSYEGRMEKISGVAAAVHFTWFGGIYQNPKNFFAQMPVEPKELLEIYPEFLLPEDARQRWFTTRTGAIVGRKTAEKFGWKVGDRVPIQATIWVQKNGSRTWEFDIVGIYDGAQKGTDVTQFFFRYDFFDEARAFAHGNVGWYTVRVTDAGRAAEVAAKIDEEFVNSPAETKTESEGAFVQGFAKQVGDITTIIIAILSAVFFTILLVAGNTIAQSVRERIDELAVMKALGFTDARVLMLVLAEACLISLLGGAAGLAIAWLAIARGDPTHGMMPMFYLPPDRVAYGLLLVLLLGLATGALPAWQAQKLRIAAALRRM